MSTREVVLVSARDADGSMHRSVALTEAGDLVLTGHDLGPGVERAFGDGLDEYEFVRTVRAEHVPAVLAALGAADPEQLLGEIAARFTSRSPDLERFWRDHHIPSEFWSRVGG